MVTLTQRVRKLEKKVAERSQTAHLDDRVVYQQSREEIEELNLPTASHPEE
jgi:hypothetical protein